MLNRGFTLIEVMVSLVILMFGLLGIAGLMAKGQKASYEAYQRQAALSIAADMVERINLNRAQAEAYVAGAATSTPVGDGTKYRNGALAAKCAGACDGAQLRDYDIALWDGLLQGYGERNAGGATVGGIVNARGCIDQVATTRAMCPPAPAPAGNFYTQTTRVSVTWQGSEDTVAPPAGLDCGKQPNVYGADTRRRLVFLETMVQLSCP